MNEWNEEYVAAAVEATGDDEDAVIAHLNEAREAGMIDIGEDGLPQPTAEHLEMVGDAFRAAMHYQAELRRPWRLDFATDPCIHLAPGVEMIEGTLRISRRGVAQAAFN